MKILRSARSLSTFALLLQLLAWTACKSHEQGVARIAFSFDPKAPRLDHSAFLFVRIVEGKAGGAVLGGQSAVPFDPMTGAMLDAITIPNGDNRVVIAEIRETQAADSRVLYYGLSAPFSIEPGKTTDVSVVLALTAPPGNGEVRIITGTTRLVRDPKVNLLLISDTGVKARVSNFVSFPETVPGASEVPTRAVDLDPATAMQVAGGLNAHMISWDLNAGLGDPCTLRDYCPRQVFVRFIDPQAYESATKTSSIVLDTKPPSVVESSVSVQLSPPIGSPLRRVGRATIGSTASVSFTLSELISGELMVTSSDMTRWTCAGTGLTFSCSARTPAGASDGMQSIQLAATDLAGNAGQFTLSSFLVDVTPPASPDVGANKIVYTRVPWGRGSSVAVSRYTLQGAPAAVEPGATLIAYNGPDTATNEEIGRTTVKGDGSFDEFDLSRADRDQVFVLAIDDAGNESDASPAPGIQAVLVHDARWIATLSRSAAFNPHRGFSIPAVRSALVQDRDSVHDFTADDAARVSGRGGGSIDVSFGASWTQIVPSAVNPTTQTEHAMAFDRGRGVAVLFGGVFVDPAVSGSAPVISGDTWEWDGHAWKKVIPLGQSPVPRFSHQMVYDAARGVVLLFGGDDGASNLLGDTWAWDGARWSQLATATATTPLARRAHQMTYDASRGRAVLFGGLILNGVGGVTALDDTWEWDGSGWIRQNVHGPAARASASLAFDRVRKRTVLFGGTSVPGFLGDTWEWDGTTWTNVSITSSTAPDGRQNHAMAYDEVLGRVVVFGGDQFDSSTLMGPVLGDTWMWSGRAWSKADVPFGAGLTQHAMVFDSVREKLVVFGGAGEAPNSQANDTYLYLGDRWKKVTQTGASPPGRDRAAAAFDGTGSCVLIYGGLAADFSPLFDTWTWDGYNWTSPPPGPSDPFVGAPVAARDEVRNTIVLGGLGDPFTPTSPEGVFEWTNGQWNSPIPTTTVAPAERDVTAMAFDAARGRTMLFGGLFDPTGASMPLADGWGWNGTVWSPSDPPNTGDPRPLARFGHAMAGDSSRRRVVLFGGLDANFMESGETWEWDGARAGWANVATATSVGPAARLSHRMIFDSSRKRTLLFGGENNSGATFGDLWQWDGHAWREIPTTGAHPQPRARPALAYDAARQTVVLFGGFSATAIGDTWEWKLRSTDRPGAVFVIDWTKANQSSDAIGAIELSAVAGAIGYTDDGMGGGVAQRGAAVEAWDAYAGSWARWGTNDADVSAPDVLTARSSTGAAALRYVDGNGQVTVRITTRAGAGNGPGFPDLAVDDVALVVHYRR
jgi:hypothetical protein